MPSNNKQDRLGQNSDLVYTFGDTKPHGLLHAIAEIEQWSFTERTADSIDPQVVTTPVFFAFMFIGWHTATVTFLTTFFTLPFSYLVTYQVIPIFGSYQPTLEDKIFAFAMSLGPTILMSFFLALLFARCYLGTTTRKAIRALVWQGALTAKWIWTFLGFVVYHVLYYNVLPPPRLEKAAHFLSEILFFSSYDSIFAFLTDLRAMFIPSAWTLVLLTLVQTVILGVSYWYAHWRTVRERALREKWQV